MSRSLFSDPNEEISLAVKKAIAKRPDREWAMRLTDAGWLLANDFLMSTGKETPSPAICHSQHGEKLYTLFARPGEVPTCTCDDFRWHAPIGPGQHRCCKHVLAYCLAVHLDAKLPLHTPAAMASIDAIQKLQREKVVQIPKAARYSQARAAGI